MLRILRFPFIVFGIVCITGCPLPNYLSVIDEHGKEINTKLKTRNYEVSLWDIIPFHHKRQKGIYFDFSVRNESKENLRLICSKSMLYSKTDTITYWRNTYSLSDTLIFTPGYHPNVEIFYLGKNEYTRKLYRKTYKTDTFYLKLNLFNKDSLIIPLQNHHNGPIWNRY